MYCLYLYRFGSRIEEPNGESRSESSTISYQDRLPELTSRQQLKMMTATRLQLRMTICLPLTAPFLRRLQLTSLEPINSCRLLNRVIKLSAPAIHQQNTTVTQHRVPEWLVAPWASVFSSCIPILKYQFQRLVLFISIPQHFFCDIVTCSLDAMY